MRHRRKDGREEYFRAYRQRPEIKARKRREFHDSRRRRPEFWMWNRARQRAARLGLAFTITTSDIHIPTHCPVLGKRMRIGTRYAPSLDRKKNTRGYTPPENIQVISLRANALKSNATSDEIRRVLRYMERCQ